MIYLRRNNETEIQMGNASAQKAAVLMVLVIRNKK